jgi:IS605 OrfB family transposase
MPAPPRLQEPTDLVSDVFVPHNEGVKLTIQLQLLPTPEQATLLRGTMRRFNEAATFAARVGFDAGLFSQPSIHKRAYAEIRRRFGLSAQLAVRAIGKAVECFARDKTACPAFRPDGAVTYDQRNLSFKGLDRVSLATLQGRQVMALVYGAYQAQRFDRIKGQCDLIRQDGRFYLLATVDLPEPPPVEVEDFLGVDLGLVQLATDSTGESFSGKPIDRARKRRATGRKQYQRKGTKNAKRRLQHLSGRQARFQRATNHRISKRLVAKAKALGTGIALEDLTFLRDRLEATVSRRFRHSLGNWGFCQLRLFVTYKARLAGVPVVAVDPRNSSRTCSQCGCCEKANRKSQAEFTCKHCGFSCNADHNAALVLRQRGLRAWANP